MLELGVEAVDDVGRVPTRPVVVAVPEGALVLSVRVLGVAKQLGEGFGGQIGSHGSTVDERGFEGRFAATSTTARFRGHLNRRSFMVAGMASVGRSLVTGMTTIGFIG